MQYLFLQKFHRFLKSKSRIIAERWRITSLFICMFFATTSYSFAQITVTGEVRADDDGSTIPGATVLVKGTTNGTITDIEGRYSLRVDDPNAILVFSYVGYLSEEIPVNNQSQINVTLIADITQLDEVVVVGYTTMTRRELTSSVSSVNARQLQDVPLSTAGEVLTGRLAGVQVTTSEGMPGAEVQIRVRGGTSITGDNSPLYIVDGIQVEDALNFLSPQEIESIDVLKDAASTAIYGARGANGVVVITTKGGTEMPTQVSYNGHVGVRSIVNTLDVMNPYDYVKYQHQIYNYNTNEDTRRGFRERYGRYEDLELYKDMPFTNWQDEVFGRDAISQTHILNVIGGTGKTNFNFNLNHTDEEGIMLNSGYVRTLASFKFDHRATDKLRLGFTSRYSRQTIEGVGTSSTGTQSSNRLRNAVRFRPFVAPGMESVVDEFDPEYANLTNLTSPVLLANQELREDNRNDVILNGWFSYELIKGLTFKSVFGINTTDRDRNTFNGVVTSIARQNNDQPVVQMTGSQYLSLTNSNTLNYRTRIGDDHNLNLLVGQEIWQRDAKNRSVTTKWLPVDITAEMAFAGIGKATPPAGLIQDAPTTSVGSNRTLSWFGSAAYDFRGKYRATVSLRRDASSLFAPENRTGYFPSGAVAWHIGEENFMQGARNWLDDLKLRASIGAVGNNRIPSDEWKSTFITSGNYGYAFTESITPGMYITKLTNRSLVWETTLSRNLAVDFSVFRGRLSGSLEVYQNSTKDLLLSANIPQTSGYSVQTQNIGETENKGLEIQLQGVVAEGNDFNWTTNFNMAFNKNTILNLGIDTDGNPLKSYLTESGWIHSTYQDFQVEVGKPVGQFYGYVTDGFYTIDDFNVINNGDGTWSYQLRDDVPNSQQVALGNRAPQPGDLKLKKLSDSDDMMITTEDRTVLGNAQPKFIGGFNQQFTYKNFDLSLFMNFSVGNKVYNANKIEYTTQYLYRDNNMLALMNDRWKWFDDNGQLVTNPDLLAEMNQNTKYWTPAQGQYFLHSFAIEDGSYLRISNLTLGYTLPENLVSRIGISKFRVYATVNNLWTITGYTGYDPEANTRRANPLTPAVDYAAYPRSRFILGGVNITF